MANMQEDYGQLISTHLHNRTTAWQKFLGNLLVIGIFVVIGLFIASYDPASALIVLVVMLVFTLPSSAPELIEGFNILWKTPKIDIYEQGILYTDKHTSRFIRWREIDDVRTIKNSFSTTNGLHKLYQGKKILFKVTDTFQNYRGMNDTIIQCLVRDKDYQQVLDDGGTIQIGQLTLTRDIIYAKDLELKWEQVHSIRSNTHFTHIMLDYDERKSVRVNTKKAPNVPVIFAFMVATINGGVNTQDIVDRARVSAEIQATLTKYADNPEALRVEAFLAHRAFYIEIAIALLALAISLNAIIPGMMNAVEWDFMKGNWFIFAAPAFAIPMVSLWLIYVNGKRLYQDSRLIVTRSGVEVYTRHRQETWAWEDIQQVTPTKVFSWFFIPRAAIHIVLAPNKSFMLDARFYNLFRASGLLDKFYADVHAPDYQRRLEQGETLVFGALTLDLTGIKYGRKHYTWDEIPSYEIKVVNMETQIVLYNKKQKQLRTIPIFRIENFTILMRLLEQQYKPSPPQVQPD